MQSSNRGRQPFLGRKHTTETKSKMSQNNVMYRRPELRQYGNKNVLDKRWKRTPEANLKSAFASWKVRMECWMDVSRMEPVQS